MSHQVALTFEDGVTRFVTAQPGQTVAEASYRARINIPVDCLDGACGTCKAFCESGSYDPGCYIEDALSAAEAAEGYCLPCQMTPRTDLVVRIAATSEVAKTVAGTFAATVVEICRHSDNVIGFTIEVDDRASLSYLPGQYVNIEVPGTDERRSYSFSTSPDEDRLTFLVKITPGGAMSTWLAERAAVGDRLTLHGPNGSFFLREGTTPLLLLAGGTGLAPILAMLRTAAKAGSTRPMHLIYGVNTDSEAVELGTLAALQEQLPHFTWDYTVTDPAAKARKKGYVTAHMDPQHLHDGNVSVYLCGPPPMVEAVRTHFQATGLEPEGFFYEKFSLASSSASRAHGVEALESVTREAVTPEAASREAVAAEAPVRVAPVQDTATQETAAQVKAEAEAREAGLGEAIVAPAAVTPQAPITLDPTTLDPSTMAPITLAPITVAPITMTLPAGTVALVTAVAGTEAYGIGGLALSGTGQSAPLGSGRAALPADPTAYGIGGLALSGSRDAAAEATVPSTTATTAGPAAAGPGNAYAIGGTLQRPAAYAARHDPVLAPVVLPAPPADTVAPDGYVIGEEHPSILTSDSLFDARTALELGVMELTIGRLSSGRITGFRMLADACRPFVDGDRFVDADAFTDANALFHEYPFTFTGNEHLLAAYQRLGVAGHMHEMLPHGEWCHPDVIGDHDRIIDAFEQGDRELARRLIIEHGEHGKETTRRAMIRGGLLDEPGFLSPGRFAGKVVLVTGAAQGIGERVARRIAAEGGRLVLADRAVILDEVTRGITRKGGTAVAVTADLETYAGAQAVVDAAVATYGRVDVAIHVVGGTIWRKPYEEYREEEIEKEIRRSLFPTLWSCRAVLPQLYAQGHGTIVNVSSTATMGLNRLPYAAAKGGVNTLTKSLAFEAAPHGVRVVATAPGGTDAPPRRVLRGGEPQNPQEEAWHQVTVDQTVESSLLKRYGTLEEQAAAICFLASDEASYITGSILPVAGGDFGG
ncbi:benzoate 1,2-dioxygenase electron transfer component BenC [Raineyella sp. LH-20]|uniref:benzoate 1,2-dioxygenase electron transfer component BenC n=1 Tax=Raineyella sp. LH-20 TaxID=3081204 RepID=UPI0029541D49|nr:benzoate 1,2-dioxygenase electron transfer component BenC [Raineyella sp. LH-20]WOP17267.1 benzoate 1,2-dioxygenase electron transfer component BenC [Raineyella sp. LH-20]